MIVPDQKVKVKWHYSNKEWFINKGYIFTKLGDYINVRVQDLMKTSKAKTKAVCDNCNKIYETQYAILARVDHHFCTRECYREYVHTHESPKNTQVKCNCYNCGKEIKVQQYIYKALLNGEQKFITCGRKCQTEWIGKHQKGEDNPNYKGGNITLTCKMCGKSFDIKRDRKNRALFVQVPENPSNRNALI